MDIPALYASGLSMRWIADSRGIGLATVHRLVHEAGIPVRHSGRRKVITPTNPRTAQAQSLRTSGQTWRAIATEMGFNSRSTAMRYAKAAGPA